jgi:hypothetical protein
MKFWHACSRLQPNYEAFEEFVLIETDRRTIFRNVENQVRGFEKRYFLFSSMYIFTSSQMSPKLALLKFSLYTQVDMGKSARNSTIDRSLNNR